MSDSGHDLGKTERQLGATRAVGRVVDAILALSQAQLGPVTAYAAQGSAYLDEVERVLHRLVGPPPAAPEPKNTLTVLFGPERPWCGSMARVLWDQRPHDGAVAVVGAQLAVEVDAAGGKPIFSLRGAAAPDEIVDVAQEVAGAVLGVPNFEQVEVRYPVFGTRQLATSVLLAGHRPPLKPLPPTLGPFEALRDAVVEEVTQGRVVVALAETLRAEVQERVARSRGASQACEQRSTELLGSLRRLQQELVTQEVVELTSSVLAQS